MQEQNKDQWKLDALGNNRLGPGDTFHLKCNRCGGCCRDQDGLIMGPLDIYRMAKYLRTTPQKWLERYGTVHIGDSSRLPVVRIRMEGADRHCPFLERNLCGIQEAKPGICAIYPLGRSAKYNADGKGGSEVLYFHSGGICGGTGDTHTARGWLAQHGLDGQEGYFLAWTRLAMEASGFMLELEMTTASQKIMQLAWSMALGLLYLEYDTGKDFQAQFEANAEKLKGHMEKIKELGGGLWQKSKTGTR